MAKNQPEENKLKQLGKTLQANFSDEELREMKTFLERFAQILAEAYLDGELSG